jgi:hypothetical protein
MQSVQCSHRAGEREQRPGRRKMSSPWHACWLGYPGADYPGGVSWGQYLR